MDEFLKALKSWIGQNSGIQFPDTPFGGNIDFNSFFYQRPISPIEQMSYEINRWWNNLSEGEKLFIPICAINVAVLGAWHIPRLQPFMMKYFSTNPSKPVINFNKILTAFSHYSLPHLIQNMYTLYNFITVAVSALGKTQFLLLYLTASIVSSLTSDMFKIMTHTEDVPSVGASGAIMAIVAYVYTLFPNTKSILKTILYYQFSSMLIRVDNTDYAAHIGGALWGIIWHYL